MDVWKYFIIEFEGLMSQIEEEYNHFLDETHPLSLE